MSYGTDTWCLGQPVTGKLATGSMLVAQALYRRITTPRGALRGGEEEADYGIDVTEYIGSLGADRAVVVLPSLVRAEALKDDRVLDASVSVDVTTESNGMQALNIQVSVQLTDDTSTFTFTVAASETSVEFLGGAENP